MPATKHALQLIRLYRHNLKLARRLADWSYIGLLVPPLGLLFCCLSRSIIKRMPEPTRRQHYQIAILRRRTKATMTFSLITGTVQCLFIYWLVVVFLPAVRNV